MQIQSEKDRSPKSHESMERQHIYNHDVHSCISILEPKSVGGVGRMEGFLGVRPKMCAVLERPSSGPLGGTSIPVRIAFSALEWKRCERSQTSPNRPIVDERRSQEERRSKTTTFF